MSLKQEGPLEGKCVETEQLYKELVFWKKKKDLTFNCGRNEKLIRYY